MEPPRVSYPWDTTSRRLAEKRRRAGEPADVMSVGEALNAEAHGVDVVNLVKARAIHKLYLSTYA